MDVSAEREALDRVVKELNLTLGSQFGLRFELVKWETHTHPDAGSDAQAVINSQFDANFDLFIGILWSRVGTETPRAKSGTIEEFEIAHKRKQESPGSITIMMYFKDEALSPSQIDTDQLASLNAFKKRLNELGVLYHSFKSTQEFEETSRIHLSQVMGKFAKQGTHEPEGLIAIRKAEEVNERSGSEGAMELNDPDAGYLDFDEIFHDASQRLTSAAQEASKVTAQLGNKFRERTWEISEAKDMNARNQKRIINLTASDLNEYAISIERLLPIIRDAQQRISISVARSIALRHASKVLNFSELSTLLKAIDVSIATYVETRGNIETFRDTMEAIPRVTASLNKSKRRVVNVMDALIEEFLSGERLFSAIKEAVPKSPN